MPIIISGGGGGGGGSQTLAQTLALGNSANSLKITSLANGSAATDAAAFGQIPVPAAGTVSNTAGDITTTSATFVDLTGATITMTTGSNRVLLTFAGAWLNSAAGNGQYITFLVDGANQGGANGLSFMAEPNSGFEMNPCLSFLTAVLTAASHTFKVQWRVGAGTGTMHATAAIPYTFSAVEMIAAT